MSKQAIRFSLFDWLDESGRSYADTYDERLRLLEFADDLGVKYVTAQLMRHRDSIASKHWKPVVAAARKRKIDGVTLDLLASITPRKSKRPRPKSGVQRQELTAA